MNDCNSQLQAVHFKYRTSPIKTSPVVLAIMGRLHHHAIDNGDVEFHNSEYSFESTSEYVPDTYPTLIKSIDDDEMDQLLGLFHSEYDENILCVDLQILET